jgi:hypothetical protein
MRRVPVQYTQWGLRTRLSQQVWTRSTSFRTCEHSSFFLDFHSLFFVVQPVVSPQLFQLLFGQSVLNYKHSWYKYTRRCVISNFRCGYTSSITCECLARKHAVAEPLKYFRAGDINDAYELNLRELEGGGEAYDRFVTGFRNIRTWCGSWEVTCTSRHLQSWCDSLTCLMDLV